MTKMLTLIFSGLDINSSIGGAELFAKTYIQYCKNKSDVIVLKDLSSLTIGQSKKLRLSERIISISSNKKIPVLVKIPVCIALEIALIVILLGIFARIYIDKKFIVRQILFIGIYPLSISIIISNILYGSKVVVRPHGSDIQVSSDGRYGHLQRAYPSILIKLLSFVHVNYACISRDVIKRLKSLGLKGKFVLVGNPIPEIFYTHPSRNKFYTLSNRHDHILSIGYLGSNTSKKNTSHLLSLNNKLKVHKYLKFKMSVMGPYFETDYRFLNSDILVEKASSNVLNVINYLDQLDILFMPSSLETFGRVVIEAQSRRVLVICYDVPGLRSILSHENACILPFGDLNKVAAIVKNYFSESSTFSQLMDNGFLNSLKFREEPTCDKLYKIN